MIRSMRWAYTIETWVLVGAILIQFALAGLGVFAPSDFCTVGWASQGTGCFALHAMFGDLVVGVLVLIQLILAFAARAPWSLTGKSAGLLGLFVLQGLLIFPYYDLEGPVRAVSALHVVNGVVIVFLALHIAGRARDLLAEPSRSPEHVRAEVVARPTEVKGG